MSTTATTVEKPIRHDVRPTGRRPAPSKPGRTAPRPVRLLLAAWYIVWTGLRALGLRRRRGEHITLYGYYGAPDDSPVRNVGDTAILKSMLEAFADIPQPKLIYQLEAHGAYRRYGEEYEISRRGWCSLADWLPVIARTDVFVMGGGGLHQDFVGDGGTTVSLLLINLLFWLAGRKIMWYSVGVGPLKSARSRRFTAWAARMARVITLRDEDSRQLLLTIGVPPERVRTTADPVFALSAPPSSDDYVPPTIGLSMLPFYRVSGQGANRDEHTIREYRTFIAGLLARGYGVALLLFENTQDREIAERILDDERLDGVQLLGAGASVREMAEAYRRLHCVIGMRFHSLVMSCVTEVPAGGVIYHPKVRGFVKQCGLERWACELTEVSAVRLDAIVRSLEAERADVLQRMRAYAASQRRLLAENDRLLRALITPAVVARECSSAAA